MKIICEKNELAKKAGEELTRLLREKADKEIFLMLSGGSCLAATKYIDPEILGSNLTIGPLDDRFTLDPKISNWLSLKSSEFYSIAEEADVNIATILPKDGETKEELAARYEKLLNEWKTENPDGIFLALLGMGEDGHTGGIMPYPENPKLFAELFENENKWIVGYDAGEKSKYRERFTATAAFLGNNLNGGVCFVSGATKLQALKKLNAETGHLSETPGRLLRDVPNLTVFTDVEL